MTAHGAAWAEVTREQPCRHCGSDSWCRFSPDASLCRRVEFDGSVERRDKNGVPCWMGFPDGPKGSGPPAAFESDPGPAPADTDKLNRAYTELLSHLSLAEEHQEQLWNRGFSPSEFSLLGVKTLGKADRTVAKGLAELFPWWQQVPGLALKDDRPTVCGWSGLLIPCRDLQGRIAGLRVRADSKDAPKYSWLSSAKYGGPSPGSALSFWPAPESDTVQIRVTEGELKAAFASFRTRLSTICAPGVSLFGSNLLIDWLTQLGTQTVILAPDADFRTNRQVLQAIRGAIARLEAASFTVLVEVWAPTSKGIDDALQAGLAISTITAEEFIQMTATPPDPPRPENTQRPPAPNPSTWEPPIPIQPSMNRPKFPTQALPAVLSAYVESVAQAFQVPVDLVALTALSVLATTVQKRVDIDTGRGSIFPLNIWTLVIYPSGGGKSRVLTELRFPIEQWEQRLQDKVAADNEVAKDSSDDLAGRLADLAKVRDRTEAQEADLRSLRGQLRELQEKPLPELFCADLTPESLEGTLGQNDGRMTIFNAEASDFFQVMAGRYSKDGNSNFGNFLSAFSQETIRTRRVIRGSSYIVKPTLTMGLAIQPTVFERIAGNREFVTRGLPARFLLGYPADMRGRRDVDPVDVSPAARADYNAVVRLLSQIEPSRDSKGHPEPYRLELKMQARQEFLSFARWAENAMNGEGELSDNKEFASRLREHLAKVTGLLHCATHPESPWDHTVDVETVQKAADIVRWSVEHVQSVLGVGEAAELQQRCAYLCERIREQKEWLTVGYFSVRALQQTVKRRERYKNGGTKALEEDLGFLEELGYLQKMDAPKSSKSKLYKMSPYLISSKMVPNVHTPEFSYMAKGFGLGSDDDHSGPQVPNGYAKTDPIGDLGTCGVLPGPRAGCLSHMAQVATGDIGDQNGEKSEELTHEAQAAEVRAAGLLF